jgi:hypothetical protein
LSRVNRTDKSRTHLVVPDSHASPDYNNKRYDLLGKLIVDIKPDVVIDIGDWFDMSSLCSYDRGTKGFEGRRYKKDIEAGIEAQDRMYRWIKRAKKKRPRMVRCLGNHEERINRAIDRDPILEDTIGIQDLESEQYGFKEVYDFLDPVEIDGVHYAHYFTTGVMGRPASSARALLQRQRVSCTMGHTHTLDYETGGNVGGERHHGLFCGVFQDYTPSFARQSSHLWNRGVVVKRHVSRGDYDIEWISMEQLKAEYK